MILGKALGIPEPPAPSLFSERIEAVTMYGCEDVMSSCTESTKYSAYPINGSCHSDYIIQLLIHNYNKRNLTHALWAPTWFPDPLWEVMHMVLWVCENHLCNTRSF